MPSTLSAQLANQVRAVLRKADHPSTAAGTAEAWRTQRDHWLDALDPRNMPEFSDADIRQLIDFLAESGPSSTSRLGTPEWGRLVDDLTPALLFSTR